MKCKLDCMSYNSCTSYSCIGCDNYKPKEKPKDQCENCLKYKDLCKINRWDKGESSMKTEQELKEKCTPEFIKWMCKLAEGFFIPEDFCELKDKYLIFAKIKYNIKEFLSYSCPLLFSTLIHRAVEGWNKRQHVKDCIVISDDNIALWRSDLDDCKVFGFKDYQPQSLTHAECAMLDCLLDIFKEG